MKPTIFCLGMFLLILFSSCRKECRTIGFKKHKECASGFSIEHEAEIIHFMGHGHTRDGKTYNIRSQSELDAEFPDFVPIEFEHVDFYAHSIIGVDKNTGPGEWVERRGFVCRNTDEDEISITLEYSLENQCAGSGIERWPISMFAIVPKIGPNTVVHYHVVDINPF